MQAWQKKKKRDSAAEWNTELRAEGCMSSHDLSRAVGESLLTSEKGYAAARWPGRARRHKQRQGGGGGMRRDEKVIRIADPAKSAPRKEKESSCCKPRHVKDGVDSRGTNRSRSPPVVCATFCSTGRYWQCLALQMLLQVLLFVQGILQVPVCYAQS